MGLLATCDKLSDADLLAGLKQAVRGERRILSAVIAHLMVVDCRKLYEEEGYSSLFAYCTGELGYSESAAYKRIMTARLALKFPAVLDAIESGAVHLAALTTIGPHMTQENHPDLLARILGRTTREAECIAAGLNPGADKRDQMRRLSAERTRFSFTGGESLRRKLERIAELMAHRHPSGKLESLIESVADYYLDRKDPDRSAERRLEKSEKRADAEGGANGDARAERPSRPEPSSPRRYIPQRVRNAVWLRDRGRCAFRSENGRVCGERRGLEFDHIVPWALGGPSNDPRNIRLLCRAHNQGFARKIFGNRYPPRPG